MAYLTQKNYNKPAIKATSRTEHPTGVSQTIPGETMTIKQIMERALNGLETHPQQAPYFDIEDLDNIQSFPIDLTDLDQTRVHIAEMDVIVQAAITERDADTEPEPVPDPPTPDPTP